MSPRHAATFTLLLGTLALAACAPAQRDWKKVLDDQGWIALDPLREDFTPGVTFRGKVSKGLDSATARLLAPSWVLAPSDIQFADSASLKAIEVGARAKPDELIGSALKSAGAAQVSTALKSGTVTFSKWGKSERQSVTLEELSRAILRTRFNVQPDNPKRVEPEFLNEIGLSVPRKADRRNRWVVYESLALTGAQFTTTREDASNLEVGLNQAGVGGVVRVVSTEGETSTFVIDRTRTVAFKAARLVRVEPSVPPGDSTWPVDNTTGEPVAFQLVWQTEPADEQETVTVRAADFRDASATETTTTPPAATAAAVMAQPAATLDPNAPPKITVAIRHIPTDGSGVRTITSNDVIPVGDAIGFDVTLDRPGYLYLANEDETSHWQILTPKRPNYPNSYGTGARLEPGRTYRLPYDMLDAETRKSLGKLKPQEIGWITGDIKPDDGPMGFETFLFYATLAPTDTTLFERAEPGSPADVSLRSISGIGGQSQSAKHRPQASTGATLAPARISPDDPLIQPHTIVLRRKNKP